MLPISNQNDLTNYQFLVNEPFWFLTRTASENEREHAGICTVGMLFLTWLPLERRQEISTSFNFFFFEYTFLASFLFKNLTIVLPVFPNL